MSDIGLDFLFRKLHKYIPDFNAWEHSFVARMENIHRSKNLELSEKQIERLVKIDKKYLNRKRIRK